MLQEPRLDPDCNQFKDFLVDHPCLSAKHKEADPYPVDALPTCDHAQEVCQRDKVILNSSHPTYINLRIDKLQFMISILNLS